MEYVWITGHRPSAIGQYTLANHLVNPNNAELRERFGITDPVQLIGYARSFEQLAEFDGSKTGLIIWQVKQDYIDEIRRTKAGRSGLDKTCTYVYYRGAFEKRQKRNGLVPFNGGEKDVLSKQQFVRTETHRHGLQLDRTTEVAPVQNGRNTEVDGEHSMEKRKGLKGQYMIMGGAVACLGQLVQALKLNKIISEAVQASQVTDAHRYAYEAIRGFELSPSVKRVFSICEARYEVDFGISTAGYEVSALDKVGRCFSTVERLRAELCERLGLPPDDADALSLVDVAKAFD